MKIILDETGRRLPDVVFNSVARAAIASNGVFHVANHAAITAMRAELKKIPPADRPPLEWEFYGVTVHFDENLRSSDAWDDKRVGIDDRNLEDLL